MLRSVGSAVPSHHRKLAALVLIVLAIAGLSAFLYARYEAAMARETCPTCRGRGYVYAGLPDTIYLYGPPRVPCPVCGGTGWVDAE
jgi:hypothetical protein